MDTQPLDSSVGSGRLAGPPAGGPAALVDEAMAAAVPGSVPGLSPAGAGPRARRRLGWRGLGGLGIAFWVAVGWLAVVAFCALFADYLPLQDPIPPDVSSRLDGPSADHWLGADGLGRDQLSRLAHAASVSLTVSLSAVAIGGIVGGALGTAVGYVRGRAETVVMAAIDVLLAFPALVLLLVVLAYVGRSLTVISVLIGFLSIPVYTRVARANTLAVAQREFVQAAVVLGATRRRILWREIIPNVVLSLAAFGLVAMGVVIVLEGSLAVLGLSVEPPDPTWGGMIAESRRHMSDAPHTALVPAGAMFLTVLSLNFVGDSLRRRVDTRDAGL
jgi:peptide/nickel transport system permease protein